MTNEEIEMAFNGRWRMKHYILENINGEYAKEIARDFFEAGIALAEPQGGHTVVTVEEASKSKIHIIDRVIKFKDSVFTPYNVQKYGQQMLDEFFDYWSEPNPSKTKMRFELQKTFEVNRRLARWARNNFNRYGNNKPTPDEQQSKLADILVG